jgi:3-oxoacyl-[acyl-carrier protein] reductase
LGYATARLLAAEGCEVAINSRSLEGASDAANRIATETGTKSIGLAGDVGDPSVPERLVTEAVSALGGLDILILNAGGPPSGPFESFDDAAWQEAIEITLLSKVRLVRAALSSLRRSQAASVLAITSYAVKQPIPNLVLSNSIRVAVTGLMKSLALELGAEGIRFNAILPAWTETERSVELLSAGNATGPQSEKKSPGNLPRVSSPAWPARKSLPMRRCSWFRQRPHTSRG